LSKYLRNDRLLRNVGVRLRNYRKKRGLTMMDVVDLSGIEYPQLSRIERGKINTSISHIALLAKTLHIKLKELFEGLD